MDLTWKASTDQVGVAKYLIYQGTGQIGTAVSTAYKVTGLKPGTAYSFTVIAADAAGNISAASTVLRVTTLAATTTTTPPTVVTASKTVIGYYTGWSTYNGLQVASIDGSKLTHINYAFANVGTDLRIALSDPYADVEKRFPDDLATDPFFGNFNQLLKLKKKYPHLKTLISVGGWGGSAQFSNAALTDTSRTTFADSAVAFIVKYGFDGVDIDWEYPVAGGDAGNVNRPEDKTNFTLLMQKLREKLDAQGAKDGKTYLLTFAGAASSGYLNNIELGKLQAVVNYVNVMSYDLHGTWETKTGLNAPLYKDPASGFTWETSVNDAIALYRNAGVPAAKLVMGLAFYGSKYDNVTNANNGLYQSFSGGSSVTYASLKTNYIGQGYTRYFHTEAKVPYLFNGSSFITYDDPESLGYKTAYIKQQQLAGAMIWSLGYDTANSELLTAVYQGLQ